VALAPTVWRTCRVLANDARLRCFAAVAQNPGAPVGRVARSAGVSVPVASLYLRHIQARGLLRAERVSRWVRYEAAADASVAHAGALLAALRQSALSRPADRAAAIRILTACTHPRRLALLAAVARGQPCGAADLVRATGFSVNATSRHLHKLESRGFLVRQPRGWCLAEASDPLSRCLLRAAIGT